MGRWKWDRARNIYILKKELVVHLILGCSRVFSSVRCLFVPEKLWTKQSTYPNPSLTHFAWPAWSMTKTASCHYLQWRICLLSFSGPIALRSAIKDWRPRGSIQSCGTTALEERFPLNTSFHQATLVCRNVLDQTKVSIYMWLLSL